MDWMKILVGRRGFGEGIFRKIGWGEGNLGICPVGRIARAWMEWLCGRVGGGIVSIHSE
jgi:hypothetical protein